MKNQLNYDALARLIAERNPDQTIGSAFRCLRDLAEVVKEQVALGNSIHLNQIATIIVTQHPEEERYDGINKKMITKPAGQRVTIRQPFAFRNQRQD